MVDLPNILYGHAYIYLNPEELFHEPNWREQLKNDHLHMDSGALDMLIGNCVLEMKDITIPIHGIKELSCKKAIIDSIKRILGNFGDSLDRCTALYEKGVIQDSLYFTSDGLSDYSRSEGLEGKQLTEWVRQAKDYSSDPKNYFPEDTKLPEDLTIEFTPTFQALRNINTLGRKSGDVYKITGNTFAECVKNLFAMYDAVTAHIEWKEQTRSQKIRDSIKKKQHICVGTIPIAELVFPDPSKISVD